MHRNTGIWLVTDSHWLTIYFDIMVLQLRPKEFGSCRSKAVIDPTISAHSGYFTFKHNTDPSRPAKHFIFTASGILCLSLFRKVEGGLQQPPQRNGVSCSSNLGLPRKDGTEVLEPPHLSWHIWDRFLWFPHFPSPGNPGRKQEQLSTKARIALRRAWIHFSKWEVRDRRPAHEITIRVSAEGNSLITIIDHGSRSEFHRRQSESQHLKLHGNAKAIKQQCTICPTEVPGEVEKLRGLTSSNMFSPLDTRAIVFVSFTQSSTFTLRSTLPKRIWSRSTVSTNQHQGFHTEVREWDWTRIQQWQLFEKQWNELLLLCIFFRMLTNKNQLQKCQINLNSTCQKGEQFTMTGTDKGHRKIERPSVRGVSPAWPNPVFASGKMSHAQTDSRLCSYQVGGPFQDTIWTCQSISAVLVDSWGGYHIQI